MFLQNFISWIKKIFSLFSNQNLENQTTSYIQNNATDAEKTNNNQVSFSDNLIVDLKDDHQNLLKMYVSIQKLLEKQDYHAAVEKLTAFKDAFSRHLIQENVKFYAYIEQNFSEDSLEHTTVKSYRKEMNQIAYAVVKFLKKWTVTNDLNQNTVNDFMAEYVAIAEALTKRIDDEERELYVLYRAA